MDIDILARQLIEKRQTTIILLRKLADEMDKHEHNGRIAHVTGLSASIVGGLITVGCLIALPFTGGLSAIGVGVAVGFGVGGGGMSLGTAIVKGRLKNGNLKNVQGAIDEDRRLQNSLTESIRDVLVRPDIYIRGANGIVGTAKLIARIADVADDALKGLGTAARVSKVLVFVGAGITVAIMPFDIYDLVKTSIDIHRRSVSETAKMIREIADELEESLQTLHELLDD